MKTVKVKNDYDYSLATVHGVFTDPEFYQKKFEGIGDRNVQVLEFGEDEQGTGFWIELTREVRSDVPGLLKKLLGEWNALKQVEYWYENEGGYRNDIELTSDGVPIQISGFMQLNGDGDSCVNRVEMQIKSSLPILGGQLEKFAAGDTQSGLEKEYDFISSYLESL
jgi:hypothetical protein